MPPKLGRKKETLGLFLQRVEAIDLDAEGGELFQLLEESKELEIVARGFRHHALSTQYRQDHHLELYREWIKKVYPHQIDDALPINEALDRACFPCPDNNNRQPFEAVLKQLRLFLAFVTVKCVPRSTEDDSISYRTLVMYRRSMVFWTNCKYVEREIEPPKAFIVSNALTEMIRCLQNRYKIRTHGSTVNKTQVGAWEIIQMMDFDLRETPCIALAECHQLAWVFGRLCALRPGSLGPQRKAFRGDLQFLAWRDVAIERGSVPGMFTASIHIRNLKTNRQDPEAAMNHHNELLL